MFTQASEIAKMWPTCGVHCMKIRQTPSHHKYAVHCMRKSKKQQISFHHLFVFDSLLEESLWGLVFEIKLHSSINICYDLHSRASQRMCHGNYQHGQTFAFPNAWIFYLFKQQYSDISWRLCCIFLFSAAYFSPVTWTETYNSQQVIYFGGKKPSITHSIQPVHIISEQNVVMQASWDIWIQVD